MRKKYFNREHCWNIFKKLSEKNQIDFKNYDKFYLRISIKSKIPLYLKSDNVFAPASSTTHLSPGLASGNKLSVTMTSPLKEEKTLIASNVKSIVYKIRRSIKKKKEKRNPDENN